MEHCAWLKSAATILAVARCQCWRAACGVVPELSTLGARHMLATNVSHGTHFPRAAGVRRRWWWV